MMPANGFRIIPGRGKCGGSNWNKIVHKLIIRETYAKYMEVLYTILSALKTFNFEIIIYLEEVPKKCTERFMHPLPSFSVDILHNCKNKTRTSTLAPSTEVIQIPSAVRRYTHSRVRVCRSVQFCLLTCSFMWPPPQSRYRIALSPRVFTMLLLLVTPTTNP